MIYKQLRFMCLSLVILGLQISANCRAEICVFGDSLSETGNFSIASGGLLPPAGLYYNGRFSNGPVWIEHLALALGEPLPLPSLLGGQNWAFNGARAAGASPYGTPDVVTQVAGYLSTHAGVANADDIFVIWAGSNDIFFGAFSGETNFIPEAVQGISQAIRALHAAGGRNFVVLDLPQLGQTPFFNTVPQASIPLNAATTAFNSSLAVELSSLRRSLRNIHIADVKISQLFQVITRTPRLFGLQNVTDSSTQFDPISGIGYALVSGVNPKRYLFWDSVHPTAQGHKLIAAYAYITVRLHCRPHGR